MVEIECLVCANIIEIPEFIDTADYDGQIACRDCSSLLQVMLVDEKVRRYRILENGLRTHAVEEQIDEELESEEEQIEEPLAEIVTEKETIDNIARYNPLRDYLASYRASELLLSFEQIENVLGSKLDTGAYTLKSWWDNDRSNTPAFAWLEAGWQVHNIDLPQQTVVFRRGLR